jgi:hypothetical protein
LFRDDRKDARKQGQPSQYAQAPSEDHPSFVDDILHQDFHGFAHSARFYMVPNGDGEKYAEHQASDTQQWPKNW